jgi:menaquinol-cytochrome c reductase iron-sulfur subunit
VAEKPVQGEEKRPGGQKESAPASAPLTAKPQAQFQTGVSGLTRRQFLSYALGGTGAFMAASVLTPLVGFSFDPVTRVGKGSLSPTDYKVSDFNTEYPVPIQFKQHVEDAWNSHDVQRDGYVIIYQNKLMIMSSICTHLGCHVDGSLVDGKPVAQPQYQLNGQSYWFHCPCHQSVYNKYGVNSPTSPAPRPLDLYRYEIKNGKLFIGESFQRQDSNWDENPNPTIG